MPYSLRFRLQSLKSENLEGGSTPRLRALTVEEINGRYEKTQRRNSGPRLRVLTTETINNRIEEICRQDSDSRIITMDEIYDMYQETIRQHLPIPERLIIPTEVAIFEIDPDVRQAILASYGNNEVN